MLKFARGAVIGATAAAALGWVAASNPASATMITPNTSGANGEPTIYQIMNTIYGAGNWTQLMQEQIRDPVTAVYNISFGVRYAQDNGALGYVPNGGTTPVTLMTFTGSGMNSVAQPTQAMLTPAQEGGVFQWSYTNTSANWTFSSDPKYNSDGLDHVIGFLINNPNLPAGEVEVAYAWKDWLGGGDLDYNDAIIQMIFTPVTSTPVPEPASVALLGTTLLAFGAIRRRRRS